MTPARRMWHLAYALGRERMFSTRMLIMLPILLLFIPGMAWGFADPNLQLPADQLPETATETMFLASIGIVFAGTMAAVIIAHDGISRDRTSGVLEVRLSQPMPRWRQGIVLIFGHWSSIALPVTALLVASMFLVGYRSDMWIPLGVRSLSIEHRKGARFRHCLFDWTLVPLYPALGSFHDSARCA